MLGRAKKDFWPRPEEVRAARHFATTAAVSWGLESSDLATVVGELAANAYRHADTTFTVSLSHDGTVLTIAVADGSPGVPTVPGESQAELESFASSGRGLLMVDALANEWGARSTPGGKIVWAELPAIPVHRGQDRRP